MTTLRELDASTVFTHQSRNLCAFNWISPSDLPAKYQRAYQIFADRIDVYDLSFLKGKVDDKNRQDIRLRTDECYTLKIPPPSTDPDGPAFSCIPEECAKTSSTKSIPTAVLRDDHAAAEIKRAVRDAIWPGGFSKLIRDWLKYPPTQRDVSKWMTRIACECGKAGVIDRDALNGLKDLFRNYPTSLNANEGDRQQLQKIGDELSSCVETS